MSKQNKTETTNQETSTEYGRDLTSFFFFSESLGFLFGIIFLHEVIFNLPLCGNQLYATQLRNTDKDILLPALE